jgi:hypothetical protein
MGKIRDGSSGHAPRGKVGQASIDNLAGAHEVVQAACDFVHWGDEVVHMCEIEINAIGLQPLEAGLDRLRHVLAIFSQVSERWIGGGAAGEFRSDHEVVPARADVVTDQRLRNTVLVVVGGIDEVSARIGVGCENSLDVFRRSAVAPGLTEHACAEC